MYPEFKRSMFKMINRLGVRARNCVAIAPIPYVRNDMLAAKNEVFRQLQEIHKEGVCQVIFFDQKEGENFPMEKDLFHPTKEGYEIWLTQVKEKLCDTALFGGKATDASGRYWY